MSSKSGKGTDASTQSAAQLTPEEVAAVRQAGEETAREAAAYVAAHPELEREVHGLITACVEAKVRAEDLPAFAAAHFSKPAKQ